VLLIGVLGALVPKAAALDLEQPPTRPPYEIIRPFLSDLRDQEFVGSGRIFPADLDADGFQEMIEVTRDGLLMLDFENGRQLVEWQFNMPARFVEVLPAVRLGAFADVTGDGFPEVVMVADAGDVGDWQLWVYDAQADSLVLKQYLPIGPDARPDGDWDGEYVPFAVIGQVRPLVLLMRIVQYDRYGRGIVAIDLQTGENVWEFESANNVMEQSIAVGDFDHDGQEEIVFTGTAPDNFNGQTWKGFSDDTSRLYVLNADGTVRWQLDLAGAFSRAYLDIADLDGDGISELITCTRTHRGGRRDRLSIWDFRDGTLLVQKPVAFMATGLVVLPLDQQGHAILVSSSDAGVQQFLFRDGHLSVGDLAISEFGVTQIVRRDLLPPPGEEAILGTTSGRVVVLDGHMNVLATVVTGIKGFTDFHVVMTETVRPLLVMDGLGVIKAEWRERPRSPADVSRAVGAVLLVVGVIAGSVALRRRRRPPPLSSSFPVRDLHARLLRELAEANHDHLGVTKGLDRLATQFVYMSSELGRTDELIERMHETWAEFHESGRSRLLEILVLARGGNVPPALIRSAEVALAGAELGVSKLVAEDPDVERVARELPGIRLHIDSLTDALKRIHSIVESYFVADLTRVVQRVLLLREEEIRRMDISLNLLLPEEKNWMVKIDPTDLRFIVDNLVGNALRAFEGVELRELTVTGNVDKDMIEIVFQDSGCGIDSQLHGRVFSAGFTERPGGGLGLARSREILEECGGELILSESDPGNGSTFMLRLRRSRTEMNSQGGTR